MKNHQDESLFAFPELRGELGRLLSGRRSVRRYTAAPVSLESVKRVLLAGQGLTSGDGKRSAPSAQALYPLRLYLIARRVSRLKPGFFAFDPDKPAIVPDGPDLPVGALLAASLADDPWLEDAAAVVIIAADCGAATNHFRAQQPDGLRGLRYVDFEAGAAAQNMALVATRERMGSVVVMGVDHAKLKASLPLPPELQPVALFCLGAIEATRAGT